MDLDEISVANYIWARWKDNTDLIRDVIQQWEGLDKHDNIRRLLMKPFFLCAFAETLNSGERIRDKGRCWLVKSFIEELWARQRKKTGTPLTDEQRNTEIFKVLSDFEEYAFQLVTGQDALSTAKVVFLAELDTLLEAKDKQFKHEEIRNYLAACYLFGKPSDENFNFLRMLEDEQRFTVHGWLLELVNDERLDTKNKILVRNRLWLDDPVLVGLGLYSETQLKSLVLPERPWEPYEVGLLKIMRGDDAAAIPETSEIRDVRLSSPGEKLLHRLSQPDLPYLIRAVPERRAVTRLEAAWNSAADPWSEIMQPLAPITREWLENRRSLLRGSLDFAYGVLEPPATLEQSTTFAKAIDEDDVEAEMLVQLMLALKRMRARFGADREKIKGIDAAIRPLWPKVLDQSLSAKQLHRLLVHESQGMKAVSGVSQDRNLGPKIRRLVYQGAVGDAACLELVRMKPLIAEIRRLSCFGDGEEAQKFAVKLWDLWVASDDVTSVPPFTLAQTLRAKIATVESLMSDEWLARWLAHWLERLNCYEAILLQELGVPIATTPPSFIDAQGWLQAREAVKLVYAQPKILQEAVFPAHQYTPEQKRHWLAAATMSELVGLLKSGVINRSATDDVFKQAVRTLEEDSHPQHWWQLVRNEILTREDIPYTLEKLTVQLESKPVAYELLQSAKLYNEPPSERVVDLTARCLECPLDTRVHLVNSGKVSIQACWKAETDCLNEVRRKIAAGQPLQGIGDHDGLRQGSGLARGFYTLIFRRGAALNDIYFRHPAFDTVISFRNDRSREEIVRTSRRWRDGELVMGFLWVDPAAISPKVTITVTQHRRHYAATGYVMRNGEPQFDPLVTRSEESSRVSRTICLTPPTVVSTMPAWGATGVGTAALITLTFNKPVEPSTVTNSTFTLFAGSTPVAGTVSVTGATATFTPTAPLSSNTLYTATISGGVKDLSGNFLGSAYYWTFQTKTMTSIVASSPTPYRYPFALNGVVTATFSSALDASTVNANNFTLSSPSGPIPGTVGYSGQTASFTPTAPLTVNTVYRASITSGIKDLSGDAITAGAWTFQTFAPGTATTQQPFTPIPAGLWQPPSDATPSAGNYVYLQSDVGDGIGQGQTYTYTPLNAQLTFSAITGGVGVSIQGNTWWTGEFVGPSTMSQVQVGYYSGLIRWPFHNPVLGGLNWSGDGRGCNMLLGWFAVDNVTYTNGVLSGVDLRFEQQCEGGQAALHGALHWRP